MTTLMFRNLKEFCLTIFIPFLYFLAILIILKTESAIGFGAIILAIAGLIIAFFGLFLWSCGYLSLGPQAFSVLPRAKIIKAAGVYKYFRHPIYLGITLTYLGLSLSLGSKVGLFYTIFVIIPLNLVRAIKEEKTLTKEFSQEYLAYKRKTLF